MKLIKIKKIVIGDTEFQVKWDKKIGGGSFHYPRENEKAEIVIGMIEEKINPIGILNIIIHELKEIIQVEQRTRYDRQDENRAYEFHYTHKEHTDLCSRLAGLLVQFYK